MRARESESIFSSPTKRTFNAIFRQTFFFNGTSLQMFKSTKYTAKASLLQLRNISRCMQKEGAGKKLSHCDSMCMCFEDEEEKKIRRFLFTMKHNKESNSDNETVVMLKSLEIQQWWWWQKSICYGEIFNKHVPQCGAVFSIHNWLHATSIFMNFMILASYYLCSTVPTVTRRIREKKRSGTACPEKNTTSRTHT